MGAAAPSGKGTKIDLVPILDALVVVIFFLVLSISFTELTKVSLPPTKEVESQNLNDSSGTQTESLNPKLWADFSDQKVKVGLVWNDKGEKTEERLIQFRDLSALQKEIKSVLAQFKSKFPNATNLTVSATRTTSFQNYIAVVDASKDVIPDVIMGSYLKAEKFFGSQR